MQSMDAKVLEGREAVAFMKRVCGVFALAHRSVEPNPRLTVIRRDYRLHVLKLTSFGNTNVGSVCLRNSDTS